MVLWLVKIFLINLILLLIVWVMVMVVSVLFRKVVEEWILLFLGELIVMVFVLVLVKELGIMVLGMCCILWLSGELIVIFLFRLIMLLML